MANSLGTVAVLGGGISGLAAAHRFTQIHPSPKRVILLEASSRVGGWMNTIRNPDGVIYETGPRTMRPVGESAMTTLNLLNQLKLNDKIITMSKNHPTARNRLIYVDGKMVRLPMEVSAIFKTHQPFKRPLFVAGIQDLLARKNKEMDESIHSFFSRRLGKDLAEYATDPLIRGVCAGDCREISVHFLFKFLKEYELKYGSVVLGGFSEMLKSLFIEKEKPSKPLSELAQRSVNEKWSVWSLKGGLQTFPEILAESAKAAGVELFLETPCTGLEFIEDKGVLVKNDREEFVASRVISALPSFQLGQLVGSNHSALASLLQSIQHVTVAVVNMEWKGKRLAKDAFGVLVPSSESVPILGVVFDSCSFPQGDRTILTAMMGGWWYESLFGDHATEEQLADVAHQSVAKMLGITDKPHRTQVNIQRNCIPQYLVGHTRKVADIRLYIANRLLPLDLIGASYDGVSVNDCVHNAIATVDQLISKKI